MLKRYDSSNSAEERWYYLEPGQVLPAGPLSLNDLRQLSEKKKIHKKTLVWRKGMNQWEPIQNVSQLKSQKSLFSFAFLGFGKKTEVEESHLAT